VLLGSVTYFCVAILISLREFRSTIFDSSRQAQPPGYDAHNFGYCPCYTHDSHGYLTVLKVKMGSEGKGISIGSYHYVVLIHVQHCYVTGGSTGLGLELAKQLTARGAHVSIVARNKEKLEKALEELEACHAVIYG